MTFFSKLFGKESPDEPVKASSAAGIPTQAPEETLPGSEVELDEAGRFVSASIPPVTWKPRQNGDNQFYYAGAADLLSAVEILKFVHEVPVLYFYSVETPDGTLGLDSRGFFTTAPLKTENIKPASRGRKVGIFQAANLFDFGDEILLKQSVAMLKLSGEYARLVQVMECGNCGYESPVETEPGNMLRECYCCGAKNEMNRLSISVPLGSSLIEL